MPSNPKSSDVEDNPSGMRRSLDAGATGRSTPCCNRAAYRAGNLIQMRDQADCDSAKIENPEYLRSCLSQPVDHRSVIH
jgi:hypothetical protein